MSESWEFVAEEQGNSAHNGHGCSARKWRRDGTPLCVYLDEYNGFVGPVWYRSIDTAYEEEVARVLEAAPLAASAGAVESDEVKAKHLGSLWRS